MSFTETATALNLTQSAISKQMSTLEDELEVRLFNRKNNTLKLTEAGKYLQKEMSTISATLDSIITNARKLDSGVEGALRIGLFSDQAFDDHILSAFRILSASGSVSIDISRQTQLSLYQNLLSGNIDVVNTIIQNKSFFPDCEKLIYAKENMYLAVHSSLASQHTAPLGPEELQQFCSKTPMYIPELESFPETQRAELGPKKGIPYQYTYRNLDAIMPLVTAGLCAALVNQSHVLTTQKDIALLPFSSGHYIEKCILWVHSNPNPLLPTFINAIKSQVG